MTSREKLEGLVLIVVAAALAACGGGGGGGPTGPGGGGPAVVSVTTAGPPPRFVPEVATVSVGRTVQWRNTSPAGFQHNVISDTNAWPRSPDLNPGQTFEVTFNQAGTFDYRCEFHQGMTGVIVVN